MGEFIVQRPRSPPKKTELSFHQKCCYAIFLWGVDICLVAEAVILGQRLRTFSSKRLICYATKEVTERGLGKLLHVWWEVKHFEHIEVSTNSAKGASLRLSKVWSKLQAWTLLEKEDIEVCVLIDTDTLPMQTLDHLFTCIQYAEMAGCFRGKNEWTLKAPRPAETYVGSSATKKGGGINGGVVVLKPSTERYNEMMSAMKRYSPPNKTGGEQDFLSWFYGAKRGSIAGIDLASNFKHTNCH